MASRFTVEAVFRGIDRVTAPISRIQNRVGKLTRSMSTGFRRVNRRMDAMGRGLKRFAIGATIALAATSAAFADVIGTGAGFQQTLVTAAVKFPGAIEAGTGALLRQTDQFKRLEAAAKQTGKTTEFTASQSAEALNFLAMAGFNAKSSIAALPGVVDLATVANVDLGRATDIATDSLGAFDILAGDAATKQRNLARVSDLLVATTTRANTNLEQMFEALKQGAPVATAAGQSMETTAAFIAIMANAGIKGTKAGTGLKNIMLGISAPGSAAAKIFRALEIDLTGSNGELRDAIDIFGDFAEALKTKAGPQQLAIMKEIFGKIPIAAAINLANSADAMRKFRDGLIGISGVTQKMAAIMRDTFQGRMKAMKSSIEAVKISIFGMTEGPLSDMLDGMIKWTRLNENFIATKVSDFILSIVNNMEGVVSVAGKIGIALVVFFTLATVLKTLIGIMTILNLVIGANPVVLILAAFIALIAAVVVLIVFFDELLPKLREMAIIGPVLNAIIPKSSEAAAKPVLEKIRRQAEFFGELKPRGMFESPAPPGPFTFPEGAFNRPPRLAESALRTETLRGLEHILGRGEPQIVTPAERTATTIEETRNTSRVDVTIRPAEGTEAEITSGPVPDISGIRLLPSGSP